MNHASDAADTKPTSGNTPGIQVIDRMVLLLDVIARHDAPVTLKVLSIESGLHASTAFRILSAMLRHEFVHRDQRGHYSLGGKLLYLGGRIRAGIDLQREALPVMEWLRDKVGETVHLTLREGFEIIYIERVSSHHTIRAEQVIGSRAHLHVTAVGKMILGDRGRDFCHRYAAQTGLPAYTRHTIRDAWELIRAVENDLRNGYALDNEEAELGVGCIGCLVRDTTGVAIAGLSVSAPMERRRMDWVTPVQQAASTLSRRLGYRGDA
jgi:DNA-binding IclR family transcriptional regulator